MSKQNSKRNKKIVAILALIGALAAAGVMYFDGDDSTSPDIIDVIDSGQDVIEAFNDDESDG